MTEHDKSLLGMWAIIAACILTIGLFGCGVQTNEVRQYPMRHNQGNPKFGANTRVHNQRNGLDFIVDSVHIRPHSKQVFYYAHNETMHVQWLAEGDLL